jgi:hypothetical protein
MGFDSFWIVFPPEKKDDEYRHRQQTSDPPGEDIVLCSMNLRNQPWTDHTFYYTFDFPENKEYFHLAPGARDGDGYKIDGPIWYQPKYCVYSVGELVDWMRTVPWVKNKRKTFNCYNRILSSDVDNFTKRKHFVIREWKWDRDPCQCYEIEFIRANPKLNPYDFGSARERYMDLDIKHDWCIELTGVKPGSREYNCVRYFHDLAGLFKLIEHHGYYPFHPDPLIRFKARSLLVRMDDDNSDDGYWTT